MRTLSDGRVELTPSPDSVQEPGTPLNKALLQPMADSAYDVIYKLVWYPEEDNRLAFANAGQTLSGLIADLDANKNVKIKIKKTGTNYYFDANVEPLAYVQQEYAYNINFTELDFFALDVVIHTWAVSSKQFYYHSYDLSEKVRQISGVLVNHGDDIQALMAYIVHFNDRITALESKIS
ncbi:MAG: hypothetical protein J6Q61_06535 [Bacteroidales bacterium]|nr:hypothetical protein [Bacteroidales bacterium]